MKPDNFFIAYERARKVSQKKKRTCMAPNCTDRSINSHVLQKNGILRDLCENNHLFQFDSVSQFEVHQKGLYELKSIGINDAFTFPGFCSTHDTNIFNPIESGDRIEDDLNNTARLLSYRTLCNELRRKEITNELTSETIKLSGIVEGNAEAKMMLEFYNEGLKSGQFNISYFKSQFEREIFDSEDNWEYLICEIPRLDICISSPLNILDKDNPLSQNINEQGEITANIFVTSVINIFPYKNKSYVLIAVHKVFTCYWTVDLFKKIKNSKGNEYKKLISDLIISRVEFWCLSPSVLDLIGVENIEKYFEIYQKEILNFDTEINYDFNLFE